MHTYTRTIMHTHTQAVKEFQEECYKNEKYNEALARLKQEGE